MKQTSQEFLTEKMRNNSDEFKSRFMLDILFGYFQEVAEYICEKMFINVAFWYSNSKKTEVHIDVVELSKEFGEQIIMPWLAGWHERNKRVSVKAPHLKYLKNNAARIIIPLTVEEKDVLRASSAYDDMAKKLAIDHIKEGR